ncbi:MAG: hypothetical protein KIT87_27370 [Anaerolineae bacterium]|nr:hypothetical protein [Anaerolineae bacterium]
MIQCAHCGRTTDKGASYSFYYGKRLRKKTEWTGEDRFTTTHYLDIAGSDSAFICDDCVKRQILRQSLPGVVGWLLIALIPLYLAGVSYNREGVTVWSIAFFALAIFIVLMLIREQTGIRMSSQPVQYTPNVEEAGQQLALNRRKVEFNQLGYDTLLTYREYNHMKRK